MVNTDKNIYYCNRFLLYIFISKILIILFLFDRDIFKSKYMLCIVKVISNSAMNSNFNINWIGLEIQ